MGRKTISEEEKKAHKKAYMKKYWQEHRAEQNEACRRWRERHPEEARIKNRENFNKWRAKNREHFNAYQREYRKRKKEEALEKELDKKK